ncbi:MAG: CBS domain-containing protein [Candidatus Saccharibacteria bacterium]
MTSFIFATVLLALALAGVVIRKTYYYVPRRELKRLAARHDPLASRLYTAVAYGSSLRALLWLFIGLTSAGGVVLLARQAPLWLSLSAVLLLLWAAFSWLPASRVTPLGARLAVLVTPPIVWLLNYLHPLISRAAPLIERRYSAPHHTGLFERSDVVDLLDRQGRQADNRLTPEELAIISSALNFGDRQVSSLVTPRAAIKTILKNEIVGPVLIDELHKLDLPFVLVKDSPKGKICGLLRRQTLGLMSSGQVSEHMDKTVYYLHESDSLSEALHAFFVTNYPLFVVVNSFDEYVGVATIESVLKQLLGHMPGDDFEQYADRPAVAARHATPPPAAEKADESTPEVVE